MDADVRLVSTDTSPDLTATLTRDDGSGPLDLTLASGVRFQMRKVDDRRWTVNAAAVIVGSPVNGQVKYSWAPDNLNIPGLYQSRWEVTFLTGRVQHSEPPNLIEVAKI